jgi:AbrB family looped-hinge helix DNA binding protein
MPRLRVHFDGWIVLPSTIREQLGLDGGSDLDLELGDGAVVLRPAGAPAPAREVPSRAERPARSASPEAERMAAAPVPPARTLRPVARESERAAVRKPSATVVRLLPALKARGRRRRAEDG